MIFAVISNGVVTNIIMASAAFVDQYYPGAIQISNIMPQPGIGWTYQNGEFSPPS